MSFAYSFIIKLFFTCLISLVLTPIFKIMLFRIGFVDMPNERKINKVPMPTAGGLSIFVTFSLALMFLFADAIPRSFSITLLLGAVIVLVTGLIDDKHELPPKGKLAGIVLASLYTYYIAGVKFDSFTFFGLGEVQLGLLSLPMTILWITAITNAINLIDGLDGLASGVSIIGMTTIGITGYFFMDSATIHIPMTLFILVAAVAGFLPYNLFPAKIYLGDTGALFLGYMIAVLSLEGLKNATFISLLTPIIILGVPVTDTVYAIIRRKLNKRPISSADKMHLHHRLLALGFTHKGAVWTIYCLALIFSFIALLFKISSTLGTVLLVVACLIGLELFMELIGLLGEDKQPLLYLLRLVGNSDFRKQEIQRIKKKHQDEKKEGNYESDKHD